MPCTSSAHPSRRRSRTTSSGPADVDAAIEAYRLAVDAAVRAFAHQDVVATCRRALPARRHSPAEPAADEAELAFLVPLGVALMAGPGVSEADLDVYERAGRLRRQHGLVADPSTLRLSANAAIGRRDYPRARRSGQVLLQRGLDERDPVLTTKGHYLLGVTSFWPRRPAGIAPPPPDRPWHPHEPRHTRWLTSEHFGQDPQAVRLVRLRADGLPPGRRANSGASPPRRRPPRRLGRPRSRVHRRLRPDVRRLVPGRQRPDCRRRRPRSSRRHRARRTAPSPSLVTEFAGCGTILLGRCGRRHPATPFGPRPRPRRPVDVRAVRSAAPGRQPARGRGSGGRARRCRSEPGTSQPHRRPTTSPRRPGWPASCSARPALTRPRCCAGSKRRFVWRLAAARPSTSCAPARHWCRAARSFAPTVVETHECDLWSCRARLAALDGLADVIAADAVLAGR